MTANDDLIGQVEAFLDESVGSTVMPDSVRQRVRDAVDQTPQSRPMPGLARFPHMNLYTRIGLAAAAVVAAALIGINVFNKPNVGPPTETSSPAASGAELPAGEIPPVLRTVFLGPSKDLPETGAPDRGDIDLSDGFLAYSADANSPILYAAVAVTDEMIELTTTIAGVCDEGDVGNYQWALSRGDSVLTIAEGTDDCALRAELMPGEYLRSNCRATAFTCLGNLEAGTWESHWFEPRPEDATYHVRHGAMRFTVPDGWAAFGDDANGYGLTPQSEYASFEISGRGCYDCPGDKDAISILGKPGAAMLDCSEDSTVPGVGFGAQDLVDWLRQHPGLDTTEPEPRTINGLSAVSLYIEARTDWTGTCDETNPFVAVPIFYRVGGYHWALNVGERYYVTLIDLGDGNTVAVMVDTADDADLEAFVDETRPIVDSLEFPSR
ncbi:MAG TPA: hypothetical protein VJ975_12165 [Candidatus Limnocylindria bacterium]|nr:hypothetical protein [Candidatus Limnocylindria bacterium]